MDSQLEAGIGQSGASFFLVRYFTLKHSICMSRLRPTLIPCLVIALVAAIAAMILRPTVANSRKTGDKNPRHTPHHREHPGLLATAALSKGPAAPTAKTRQAVATMGKSGQRHQEVLSGTATAAPHTNSPPLIDEPAEWVPPSAALSGTVWR